MHAWGKRHKLEDFKVGNYISVKKKKRLIRSKLILKMMNAVSVKMQHSIFAELVLSLFAFYIVQCRIHSRIMKAIEFINPETKDARFKFLSVLIVEKH